MWKKTTPSSFRSPFFAQGDIGTVPLLYFFQLILIYIYIYINFFLGFFNYKNKKYGAFFCAVQTFSKTVFAFPIKDLKSDTLIKALEAMSKVLPLPPPPSP
jgi:hypothetical protein